ncbi:MAG TPA: CRISPR-associated helicase Cas3' [Rhodobacteraceae bacterium]|nr:CRISPR-associated helicase Cas3' [Paracoccaceae bacterium]
MFSSFGVFAHSIKYCSQGEWERLVDHLESVADLSGKNASEFTAKDWGIAAGLLHDLGKSKPGFQAYLRGERGSDPHSGEGARYAREHLAGAGKLLAYCIAGHHAGLPNGLGPVSGKPATPLNERLQSAELLNLPEGIALPALSTPAPLANAQGVSNFTLHFFTRMLFSALVDADFLETEKFYDKVEGRENMRGWAGSLDGLAQALTAHLAAFGPPESRVNKLRSEVLTHAREQAEKPPGLFTLTVPTGGGKTLTSLAFALAHARKHRLKRVIYVIPYTSIVEQTADVFRKALGDDDAVLEHHAVFDWEGLDDPQEGERLKLAAQNWDRPIIVTTAVQFFESLYANRPSKCRKLHRLARAVIVLDEAQTLPLRLLRPCLAAVKELARGYGASVVFCTATQPALIKEDGFPAPEGLARDDLREIAPDPPALYEALRRVRVRDAGALDDAALAGKIAAQEQVLAILNNRRHVRALYDALADLPGATLLTTLMTAAHRRKVLQNVRDALAHGRPVRLVATSLVEAGVDVDFPQVWREVAGIDSVAQAAGRCNREGKQARGEVFVFRSLGDFAPPADLKQFAEIGAGIMAHHDDPLSLNAVRDYFRQLYWDRGLEALDSAEVGRVRGIMAALEGAGNQMDFPFADIANAFRIIEDASVPLILQGGDWGIPPGMLKGFEHRPHAGPLARDFQPYQVQIPPYQRAQLLQAGAAETWREGDFGEQFVLLTNQQLYDAKAGFSADEMEDLGDMMV